MTPQDLEKKLEAILNWQSKLVIREAVIQNISEVGNLHITNKMIEEAKASAILELKALIEEVGNEVIGKSPENPYGIKDIFFHEWGHQASEYDKYIRKNQRTTLHQLVGKEK